MAASVPANRIRLPPYCWRSSERFSGFVAIGTTLAEFGGVTVFVLISKPRFSAEIPSLRLIAIHHVIHFGALRFNVVVIVPEPDDWPGQVMFITECTEAGRA